MRGFTTRKRCLVVAVMAAVLAAATLQFQAQAEITREDGILLSLMFRSRYVPYSQGPNPDPAVIEISEKADIFDWFDAHSK